MNEPYRFCFSCGHRLVVTKRIWSYDMETGSPNVTHDYDCPRRNRIVGFFGWSHPCTETESYVMYA
jgi:hypothetical protein